MGVAVELISIPMACVMGLTSIAWVQAATSLIWLTSIRRRYAIALVALGLAEFGGIMMGARALTHVWLASTAGILSLWITPFIAVPLFNGLARLLDRGRLAPVAEPGARIKLATYVFDVERARQRQDYQPPPVL